jgi:hypothetical protein
MLFVPSRLLARAAGLFLVACLALAPPLRAEPTPDEATLNADLRAHMDNIESDLAHLHEILIATNLATDPSARAAAIADATASVGRLARECREAEGIYAKLQQLLPGKVDAASRAAVLSDLADIRADLGEADSNLTSVGTLVASAR